MEKQEMPSGELHELAPSYALGALDAAEKAAFEKHLESGCASCESELRALREVAGELAGLAAEAPPPPLRQRLLDKVARAPRAPGIVIDEGGLLVSRSAEIPWRTLSPGIAIKPLYIDSDRLYRTCLVRIDAGAHYPRHSHEEVEELFVLSGDLRIEGEVMFAGDYCRADAGTIHDESFSETGCVFLVRACQRDKILA